jgi:hypothetical protein
MKHLLLMLLLIVTGTAQAGDREPRWRPFADRQAAREERERDNPERAPNGFAERRERLRALREEMLRNQPHPQRDDDAHRISPDRRDDMRPLPSRESEGFRRLSPEERREFRRQIHEAGRDVYHR